MILSTRLITDDWIGMDQSCSSEPIRGEGQGGGLAGTLCQISTLLISYFTHAKYYNGSTLIADFVKNWPGDFTILDDRPASYPQSQGLEEREMIVNQWKLVSG